MSRRPSRNDQAATLWGGHGGTPSAGRIGEDHIEGEKVG